MLFQIFRGLHGYCSYLHVALQSLTPLFKICHVLTLCIGPFLLQDIYFVNMYCAYIYCAARLVDSVEMPITIRCFL